MTAPGRRDTLAPTDPFSPNVRTGRIGLTGLLRAQGFYRLKRDIERYASGDLGGRSYLISGHRGAGKTALVHGAIEEVRQEQRRANGKRPLLVRLPAPALLNVPVKPGGADASAAVPASTEQVLRGITTGLFHALVEEYLDAMEGIAEDTDIAELAAHLRTSLLRDPTLPQLRDLWFRAGRLEGGVLGCHGGTPAFQAGVHEVATLWQALQAWQRVVGSIKEKVDEADDDELKREATLKQSFDPSALVNTLVGVGTGAAAGLAVAQGTPSSPMAVLAATVVTLVTFKTLDLTTTSTRTRRRDLDRSYEENTSIGSVARLLPRLVDQLRSLGLAPVFVIDELDKVPDLGTRLQGLLDEVKQLTAEEAFFCFLVDRAYFEELTSALNATAYPVQHTWFTTRLFVSYGPAQLGPWLGHLLLRAASPGPVPGGWELDCHLWPYLLLFRSEMHFHSLCRELARLDEAIERDVLPAGHVRGAQYRGPIFYQLALEHVLTRQELARWIDDQPYNGQIANDALYYPARMWTRLEPFDVTPEALKAHLLSRQPKDAAGVPTGIGVTDQDLALLTRAVRRLCELLAAPSALQAELVSARGRATATRWEELKQPVQDAAIGQRGPLLARLAPDRFGWKLDVYGRVPASDDTSSDAQAPEAFQRSGAAVAEVRGLVASVDEELRGMGLDLGVLADRYGLLRTSPAFAGVQRALARLASEAPGEAQQRAADERTVLDYAELLCEALPAIHALVAGIRWLATLRSRPDETFATRFVRTLTGGAHDPEAFAWAARMLLSMLRGNPTEKQAELRSLFSTLATLREWEGASANGVQALWSETAALRARLSLEASDLLETTWSERASGLVDARARLAGMLDPDGVQRPLSLALLAGIVANPVYARVFADPQSLSAWSDLAAFALGWSPDGGEPRRDDALAGVALARLGFVAHAAWIDPEFGRARDVRSVVLARPPGESIFVIRAGDGGFSADWPTLHVPTPLVTPPDEPITGLGTWTERQFPAIQALLAKADFHRPARWVLDIGKVDDLEAVVKPIEKLVPISGAIGHVPKALSARMPVLEARTPAELVTALRNTPRAM